MGRATKSRTNQRSPQAIDVIAGRNLRIFRCIRGYSQEDLGDEAGVSFQQIQKYESGKNRMSLSRAQEFASILRVGIDELFRGADTVPTRAQLDTSGFNRDVAHHFVEVVRVGDEIVPCPLRTLVRPHCTWRKQRTNEIEAEAAFLTIRVSGVGLFF
jgi:transcriptional regulator with XRE-family HTH domain